MESHSGRRTWNGPRGLFHLASHLPTEAQFSVAAVQGATASLMDSPKACYAVMAVLDWSLFVMVMHSAKCSASLNRMDEPRTDPNRTD